MSSIATQNSSSEGSSTSVETGDPTQYLQTIFQELTPDSQKLDPQIYKVLKYDKANEDGVADITKKIDDIIDQQQSSPVLASDIVIIVYDGTTIEEDVLEHLEGLDVRITCLSGPSDCLILTVASTPHEQGTLFLDASLHEILSLIRDKMISDIQSNLKDNMRVHILSKLNIWLFERPDGSQEQQSQRLQAQLDELREALNVEIQTILPNMPVQSIHTLYCLLYTLMNQVQQHLQGLLEEYDLRIAAPLHRQTQRQMDLLNGLRQQLQSQLPSSPQNILWNLVQQQKSPEQLMVVPTGSLNLPIFAHSARIICRRVFEGGELHTATGVLRKKKWDADFYGCKIPDYTICPGYLAYIRSAQNEQLIPTVTVEVGMCDSTVKVILDSLFTILGTRFQVDAAYGVDLRFNKPKKILKRIDIFHFDISLETLDKIRKELTEKEKATVSLVIAQKALLKCNDLRALQLLREWAQSGSTDDDEYQRVRDRISDLKVEYLLPYGSTQLGEQDRASKGAAMDTLKLYEGYPDDMLQMEMEKYGGILASCRNDVNQYWGPERSQVDEMQYVREGEIILIHRIFERRKVIHLDEKSAQPMEFCIKDFTGIRLLEIESISLFPKLMGEIFRRIYGTFLGSSLDDTEVCMPLLYYMIRENCIEAVAKLNYPGRSPGQAKAALEEAYGPRSSGRVLTLKAKIRHVDVEGQLRIWNVEPEEHEYGNKILFIREYSKRYLHRDRPRPPFEPSGSLQGSSQSFDVGELYGNTESNEAETRAADALSQSSQTLVQPKRDRSSSPSNGQGQTEDQTMAQSVKSRVGGSEKKLRKLSGALWSRWSSSSTNNELPRKVSQCLDKVKWLRRRRILPLFMDDSLRLHLEVVERSPRLLKALEILLENEVGFIRGYLSNPSLLVESLYALLERAERAENDNSAGRSGGH